MRKMWEGVKEFAYSAWLVFGAIIVTGVLLLVWVWLAGCGDPPGG